MYPEPTELLLIGCSTESGPPRFGLGTPTPHINSQTFLTIGNFTLDEWNNLLFLFNISHFSLICCAKNSSLTTCTRTMSKRMQVQKGDNRIVAKSKPTTMNLAVSVSTSSSTVNSPIASKRLWIIKASCRTDWSSSGKHDARNSNHDAASSSQGWQKDALLDGLQGNLSRQEDQEHLNYLEEFVGTGKPVVPGYQGYPGTPGTPGDSGDSEAEGNDKDWPPYVATLCASLFDRETNISSQFDGSNERPRCEHSCMGAYLCLSLFKLQFILVKTTQKFSTTYHESTLEICETVISNDSEVDHGSDRNYRTDHD